MEKPIFPEKMNIKIEGSNNWILTPKIPGPFLPISTSKMLIISKKSQK
jgi:hypothetical protein